MKNILLEIFISFGVVSKNGRVRGRYERRGVCAPGLCHVGCLMGVALFAKGVVYALWVVGMVGTRNEA